jgi:hypothetical protein
VWPIYVFLYVTHILGMVELKDVTNCALVVHDVVQNALDWAIQTLPLPSHLFAYGKFLLAWLSCTLL